jgi:hypothetical protein
VVERAEGEPCLVSETSSKERNSYCDESQISIFFCKEPILTWIRQAPEALRPDDWGVCRGMRVTQKKREEGLNDTPDSATTSSQTNRKAEKVGRHLGKHAEIKLQTGLLSRAIRVPFENSLYRTRKSTPQTVIPPSANGGFSTVGRGRLSGASIRLDAGAFGNVAVGVHAQESAYLRKA